MEAQHKSRINIFLAAVSCGELTHMADLLEDATPEGLSYPKDTLLIHAPYRFQPFCGEICLHVFKEMVIPSTH